MNLAVGETQAGASLRQGAPLLRFETVGKAFPNGTVALAGLDMAIRQGDFLSLLGPSGCGKSTALRLIAGLARPSSGRILWESHAGEIGFVFQEPTLMPWATVFDNVRLPLRLKKGSGSGGRDDVLEALDLVGLSGFEQVYPRELSGGMKMRVSIARALVTRPAVLLMDEPFAALDEITRFKLNDLLLALWERLGWTVVFVTHSVFESVFLASRIVVMAARPGRVVGEIPVDAPYPRDEAFRTSSEYGRHCRSASELLHKAMDAREEASP